MSNSNNSEGLKSPQVLTSVITGIVTVVVAVVGVLPNILNSGGSAPAPTSPPIIIVATATTVPPTNTVEQVVQPSSTPQPEVVQPTSVPPTHTPEPPTAQPSNTAVPPTEIPQLPAPTATTNSPAQLTDGNARLFYDSASFTLLNNTNKKMSLENIVFRSANGEWEARGWGPSVYNSIPKNNCLRLRDQNTGQRNPPSECGGLHGLMLVGESAIFWRDVESFDVFHDGTLIASCATADNSCYINIP